MWNNSGMGSELQQPWRCPVCGETHSPLYLSGSIRAPIAVTHMPAAELDRRVVITADQCVVDGRDHYLRGRIAIPVHQLEEPFIWGVWARVGTRDFLRTNHLWKIEGREREPAYPGLLDSDLPLYRPTVNLQVSVHTQPVGRRPHFTVDDPSHSLAVEQRRGISLDRVFELAGSLLHASKPTVRHVG